MHLQKSKHNNIMLSNIKLIVILCGIIVLFSFCEGRTKYSKKQLILQQRETNPANFVRLVVMRLVYGVATTLGLGDNISGVLNGAFVPPGADDYSDYGDDGILDDF